MQKEVYPLITQLKTLVVSQLSDVEKEASAALLAEGMKLGQVVSQVTSCFPFLNRFRPSA